MSGAAIVPLNVAALRVNSNDALAITPKFKGRVAAFDQLGNGTATTGDALIKPLESGNSTSAPLRPGIHLHWELPDHFRRGKQSAVGGPLVFPDAPNRWLVTRFLRVADSAGNWGPLLTRSWVVESDAVCENPPADGRDAIPIPLPAGGTDPRPYQYLGRVVTLDAWLAGDDSGVAYLPDYRDAVGQALRLTAMGFVGPGFASFYPDCCSVFGFWDNFADQSDVAGAINANTALKFEAAYQVCGWLDDPARDPLATLVQDAKAAYAARLAQCRAQGVAMDITPSALVRSMVVRDFGWALADNAITATVVPASGVLQTLEAPTRILCAGTLQSVLWDNQGAANRFFLGATNPDGSSTGAVWTDIVKLAVGNSAVEALSALLTAHATTLATDPDPLRDDAEMLLDALQLGLLYGIEKKTNRIADLEEMIHARGFAQVSGGTVWVVQPAMPAGTTPQRGDPEMPLPLALAEQLAALNTAQKAYDQARAALGTARRQLFMDWYRYVLLYTNPDSSAPGIDINVLTAFLSKELSAVQSQAANIGLLVPRFDQTTQRMTGLQPASKSTAGPLADAVRAAWSAVAKSIADMSHAELQGVPAAPFWLPNEPVIVMQGNRIEPARRNGGDGPLALRTQADLVDTLKLLSGNVGASVSGAALSGMPVFPAPLPAEVTPLAIEAWLTQPMFAGKVIAAWAAQGGSSNPAVTHPVEAAAALAGIQGGPGTGLFAAVRAPGYKPAANPHAAAAGGFALDVTFSNSIGSAWLPVPIAWSAQTPLPELSATRLDPFLPTFLAWTVGLDPLARGADGNYRPDSLRACWNLGMDAIDLTYLMNGGKPAPFEMGTAVPYRGSNPLSKRPSANLIDQIDRQLNDHPDDPYKDQLTRLREVYARQNIMAQTLGGLATQQVLRKSIPAIPIEDLIEGGRDALTSLIADAATGNPQDIWYDGSVNNDAPIPYGAAAQLNFGPLRGGILDISMLEIVDVFGQRMTLTTSPTGIKATPAYAISARSDDSVHAGQTVLPPRLLAPTRLWFRWLSAAHDNTRSDHFVEANTHPATSPVCGWVLPNHLDNSLSFYNADGQPIGSFGLEHGANVYRTRPGNGADDLRKDIGPAGQPLAGINAHVAAFMWHLNAQSGAYLGALMQSILAADSAVHPSRPAEDAALAVLLGQPLAITRAVVGIETLGATLPLSQANNTAGDPFPADVAADRYVYAERQKTSSGALGNIQIALRLGDVSNLDDGLVGYMLENAGAFGDFTSAYAPATTPAGCGVVASQPWSLPVTLNAAPRVVTMLIDPRAPIHAVSGILPVEELSVAADQYAEAMRALAINFVTRPVLRGLDGLSLPLPEEAGYDWSWVTARATQPMAPGASQIAPRNGYSPQRIEEGWLQLQQQSGKETSIESFGE